MYRGALLVGVVGIGLAVQLAAAERATFVLTDGSRQSGEVVFHGSGNRNIVDNFLNLGEGGRERTFPVDQVALIDFAGGEPSAADFSQLPTGAGHLLVMRGGNAQRGKLINLTNGDTVQWQNESGQDQQFAIRDVARIYLDASAARRLYPQFANAAPTSTRGSDADADTSVPRGAVRVSGNQDWTPTGVRVSRGQRVAFSATGQIQVSTDPGHTAGPDGNPNVPAAAGVPVPEMPVGGLIARVGSGPAFPIGSNREPIAMPAAGQLMLGINDGHVSDNTGAFAVMLSNDRSGSGRRR